MFGLEADRVCDGVSVVPSLKPQIRDFFSPVFLPSASYEVKSIILERILLETEWGTLRMSSCGLFSSSPEFPSHGALGK